MRFALHAIVIFATMLAGACAQAQTVYPGARIDMSAPDGPPREVLDIWPGGTAPGSAHLVGALEQAVYERSDVIEIIRDRYTFGVTQPRLTVFEPETPNGAAILLIPGGGYRWVVLDKEGYECAERFAADGYTVFVMVYRLPGEGHEAGADAPLQDAQRAMRLIRARAAEYGLSSDRIGVMGFSAGGHLAGSLTTRFDAEVYAPQDEADAQSARPDFSVLVYPVASMRDPIVHEGSRARLLGEGAHDEGMQAAYSIDENARTDAPATFILHAADDSSVPVENALRTFDAFRTVGAPVEMHVFENGGHGFGLRYAVGRPVEAWPDLVTAWIEARFSASATEEP